MNEDYLLSSYHYELPSEAIAQQPALPRDSSRLLVIDSPTTFAHRTFRELPDCLQAGDLLVLNNTRVFPARLYGRKSTGARVEVLLLEERQPNCWLALVKPGKRFTLGSEIWFFAPSEVEQPEAEPQLRATAIARDEATGGRLLQFDLPPEKSLFSILEAIGQVPLPPYIQARDSLPSQYQTVYARELGSAAAPTAGLHFTEVLLDALQQRGISIADVTLHVGVGTFRPVETEDIRSHAMHSEWFEVNAATVEKILQTKAAGGRVIAVGTTVARSLEGTARAKASESGLSPFSGRTNLFIYPGYQWQVVDGLITNFHLPGSSLLMLVSALVGRKRLLELYQTAIAQGYRFYSFGDAMLILPEARGIH
ncbi:tRNA preQ1(34) S-adenosylmethionine ribosyltransferase-isomerase QueA [Oscillatoria sp. FACHB-1406]|uniref:tRNA preQ1(34) S-adenosylmethionine ribosyltransferase-isomerase QueA n=1 Tax=Oscillatoria sp. FACHB-1406 TaxID=2692846 RepID=UPI0016852789|nr:tRNA preQ1(34) S-adenosylmethionine ribosyltransferase-isomerase QueA [Oscillatoria sp. FACHB-1406]MBD2579255.1 tRNA preQ1(34) S-adenosylmethionine ribosyltransferase-isomerase QueA [Oscillatoria sp. FACHB-1406]